MKVFVLNLRSIAKICAILAVCILLVFTITSKVSVSQVFSNSKDLPIYSVDSPEKKVAITFDCAWGADDIPGILNTLKSENIRATFFIVGQWAEKFPQAVKMMADDGHDISNHSYSHLRMGAINKEKIKSEITLCGEKLSALSGKKCDLFRAPYGDYNNNVIASARELGYYTIQWDVDSLDWKPGISREEILNRILTKVGSGSIILFHNDTPHTAKMLPDIITALKKEGYGFSPVSEMIMKDNFHIDYTGKQRKKN